MNDKCGHSVIAFGTVCHSNDDVPFCLSGRCDEHFCSIQDIIIAIFHSYCLYIGCIRTYTRLCQGKTYQFICKSSLLIFFFLFWCAIFSKQSHTKTSLYRINNTCCCAHFCDFFKGNDIRHAVAAFTIFRFRIGCAEETIFKHFRNRFYWKSFFFIQCCCQRFYFLFSKLFR